MDALFEIALNMVNETVAGLPYVCFTRPAEKEGKPHTMVYVKDGVFASGKCRGAIPESVPAGGKTYTVGVAQNLKE